MGCVHPPPQRNRRICRPRWHMSTRGALGFPLVALLLCPDSNPIRLSPERLYRQDFLRRSPLRNQKGQLSPCFLKKENFRIQRAHPLLRRTLLVFLVSPAPPWTPLHHLLFPRAPVPPTHPEAAASLRGALIPEGSVLDTSDTAASSVAAQGSTPTGRQGISLESTSPPSASQSSVPPTHPKAAAPLRGALATAEPGKPPLLRPLPPPPVAAARSATEEPPFRPIHPPC